MNFIIRHTLELVKIILKFKKKKENCLAIQTGQIAWNKIRIEKRIFPKVGSTKEK